MNKEFQLKQEYCKYLHERIQSKLLEANENELLTYFLLSVHTGLRQMDIFKLRWNQIDFKTRMIKNVKIQKLSNQRKGEVFVDIQMYDFLFEYLKKEKEGYESESLILANISKHSNVNVQKIQELTGIINLSGHMFRQMKIFLHQ